ncbi:MAG: hypothetical protein ABTQ27_06235 [Amaricoccus sp.]|uniref:hypothetical protein n=1 Tax=Amaricoccus sp. TaxID=1872485 RepID=UPI003314CCDF
MGLLMDGLLMAASLFAGAYCWVLARRVRDLKDLDKGLGGSIVNLTRQIELARATLDEARSAAKDTRHDLGQLSARAETAAAQLRLLLAAVKEQDMAPVTQMVPQAATRAEVPPAPVARPLAPPETPTRAPRRMEEPSIEPPRIEQPGAEQPRHEKPAAARPEPEAAPARTATAPDIPKPRALPPLNGLLRRTRPEPAVVRDEDEILDALRAIAGGGR